MIMVTMAAHFDYGLFYLYQAQPEFIFSFMYDKILRLLRL